jgi:hypothetical protein
VDIMTQHDNLTEDQEKALAYRQYLINQFGEDVTIGTATDPPATGRSSAQVIVQERKRDLRDLRREDRDANLAVAAALRADADAFDRYTADPDRAGEQDRNAAHRHAIRNNLIPRKSTPQLLVEQGQRQRRTAS